MTEAALMLDIPEQPSPPPRPTRRTPSVLAAIVDGLMNDVVQWFEDDWRESERESTKADLLEAIQYGHDGYTRAKRLDDRHHWSCDAVLVEILDSADGWTEERRAVSAWVAANGIRPKFSIGDEVLLGAERELATIANIDEKHALYTVRTAKWAAENPGQIQHKQSGTMVPFERCEQKQ